MRREQTVRRGKVGCFNRKNPTCIRCTQAQTQQEAACWAKACLEGLGISWEGPGTSAAPTSPPWSWAAAQPHAEAESPQAVQIPWQGEDKWWQAQGKVSWGWSETSRQHGLASGVWK